MYVLAHTVLTNQQAICFLAALHTVLAIDIGFPCRILLALLGILFTSLGTLPILAVVEYSEQVQYTT